MEKSENFTTAQRVRRAFMVGRPRKHDIVLSPMQAVLQTCLLMDEVQTEMLAMDLDRKDAACALVVQQRKDNVRSVHTFQVKPDGEEIKKLVETITALSNPQPLGVIFRIVDRETTPPKGRDWVRPFLTGKRELEGLSNAMKAQATPGAGMN